MPAFPQFASLPVELQRAIWQSILDEAPEPVVQISSAEDIIWRVPFSANIYLSTNALMHTCHVSREMARKQLMFSRVEQGACFEPYRYFDPNVDAIYISDALNGSWSDDLRDKWFIEAARIRHLALNQAEMEFGFGLSGLVNNLGIFKDLRTVSLVCADHWWELRELDLSRRVRYRLVDYSETETIQQTASHQANRQRIEPWSLVKSFQKRVMNGFMNHPGSADCQTAPYDKSTGEFLFDIVPSRIEAVRESIPKELARNVYYSPDTGELRDILQDPQIYYLSICFSVCAVSYSHAAEKATSHVCRDGDPSMWVVFGSRTVFKYPSHLSVPSVHPVSLKTSVDSCCKRGP